MSTRPNSFISRFGERQGRAVAGWGDGSGPIWDSETGDQIPLDCAAMVKAPCTGYADDVLGEKNRR